MLIFFKNFFYLKHFCFYFQTDILHQAIILIKMDSLRKTSLAIIQNLHLTSLLIGIPKRKQKRILIKKNLLTFLNMTINLINQKTKNAMIEHSHWMLMSKSNHQVILMQTDQIQWLNLNLITTIQIVITETITTDEAIIKNDLGPITTNIWMMVFLVSHLIIQMVACLSNILKWKKRMKNAIKKSMMMTMSRLIFLIKSIQLKQSSSKSFAINAMKNLIQIINYIDTSNQKHAENPVVHQFLQLFFLHLAIQHWAWLLIQHLALLMNQ